MADAAPDMAQNAPVGDDVAAAAGADREGIAGGQAGADTVAGDAMGSGGSAGASLVKLSGTRFGSGPPYNNNPNVAYDKAFDGDLATAVDDSNASNGYTGMELKAPADVSLVRYYPRGNGNERMVGGQFQCSTTSKTDGYTTLHTVAQVPPSAWTEVSLARPTSCRFVRYLGPPNGHTNVTEIEFWGPVAESLGTGPADAGAPLTSLALDKTPTAISEQSGNGAGQGNDGKLGTKYCPGNTTFPVWWEVDLGASYPLVQSVVNFEKSAGGYKYAMDVSTDESTWIRVVDKSESPTGYSESVADNFNARARYVRLTIFDAPAQVDRGCFWELSVFGYKAPGMGAGSP